MASVYLLTIYPNLQAAERAISQLLSSGYATHQVGVATSVVFREMAAESTSDATNLEINVNAGFLAQIMGQWSQSELVHVAGIGKLIVLGVLEAILSEVIYFEDCLDAIGVPQSRVELILESLRQGDALVTIQASEGDFEKVSEILCRHKPVDVESRAQQWRKRGWRGFDAMFDPYTVEEIIRKKRQYIPPRTNNRAECIDRVLQQYRVNAAQDS